MIQDPACPVLQRCAAAHLPGHDPAGRGGVSCCCCCRRSPWPPGVDHIPDRRDLHSAGHCHGVRGHRTPRPPTPRTAWRTRHASRTRGSRC
ncbi:hypothetical protein QJS66_21025 [Kocuria rhizophila]|nr:hypothetical protein QJS66_21025 [Kocuria rhizophila]